MSFSSLNLQSKHWGRDSKVEPTKQHIISTSPPPSSLLPSALRYGLTFVMVYASPLVLALLHMNMRSFPHVPIVLFLAKEKGKKDGLYKPDASVRSTLAEPGASVKEPSKHR